MRVFGYLDVGRSPIRIRVSEWLVALIRESRLVLGDHPVREGVEPEADFACSVMRVVLTTRKQAFETVDTSLEEDTETVEFNWSRSTATTGVSR